MSWCGGVKGKGSPDTAHGAPAQARAPGQGSGAPAGGVGGSRPGDFFVMAVTETRPDIWPAGLPLRREFQVTLRSSEVNRQERQALPAPLFQFIPQAGL